MSTTEQEREESVREGVAEWLATLPLESTELHNIKQAEWNLLYSIVADKLKQRDAQREADIERQAARKIQTLIDAHEGLNSDIDVLELVKTALSIIDQLEPDGKYPLSKQLQSLEPGKGESL